MIRSAGRTSVKAAKGQFGAGLRGSASILALGAMFSGSAALAQPADSAAQPADSAAQPAAAQPTDDQAIVVTGIRASLANSQNIKRNSDTVVDAITAQDIGALPDRSVTEALARVPGVSMNRFAGSNDPDHFSVEGSGVVIRGLSFVRSEFNGRDAFSTGVYGQAINFSDVPAELLGSVAVYKNATAEMTEGGLSGTVDLRTRLPFDQRGFHISFDAEENYGDFSRRWAPTGSILISDNWDTSIGRIGLLADVSYSRLYSRADGIQIANFQTRDGNYVVASNDLTRRVCRNRLPNGADTQQLPPSGGAGRCGDAQPAGSDTFSDLYTDARYAPLGGQFRTQDYDRRRFGIAAAAQWESLDHRAHLTAQYLRSDSQNNWGEHTFEAAPDLSDYNTYPAGCQQNGNGPSLDTPSASVRAECRVSGGRFVFGNNGRGNGYTGANSGFPSGTTFPNYTYGADNVFESGFITLPGSGWRSASSGSATTRVPTGGMQNSLARRQVNDQNVVSDYGLNFRFSPNEHWDINLDAQRVHATHDALDVSVFGSNFADQEIDLTGNIPVIIPHKPLTLSATWAAPNPTMAGQTDSQYFGDRQWEFWRAAMDHIEHSVGNEWAFQGDVAYNFNDDGFLRRIKFGARYSDRDQTIRYTTYNWGAISEVWNGTAVYMDQNGTNQTSFDGFSNFYRGQVPGPPGGYYYNGDLISGYQTAAALFKSLNSAWQTQGGATNLSGNNCWLPLAERRVNNCAAISATNPALAVAGTPFLPSEIQDVSERNRAAYVMLSFGNDEPIFGNVRLAGNIGVRYVDTQLVTAGAFRIPTAGELGFGTAFGTRCASRPAPPSAPPGTPNSIPGGVCNLGAAAYAQLQQFFGTTGVVSATSSENNYHYFLPSLNLRLGLSRDLIMRFAASRAIARPQIADVRPFFTASVDTNNAASGLLNINRGNPLLRPARSDQFDLTLEWYFARVGSLTFDAFYKRVNGFFYQSVTPFTTTNNGVTETFAVRQPANFDGTGTVKGFEVAYQQTFDFLPGLLGGLGVSANYTYIESRGLPNSLLNGGNPSPTSPIGAAGNLPLEQLSKHNVNASVFYERGPVSLRAAYNWRSRFLLTSADVIIPYFPIYNSSTGQLDASAFYSITPQIKIGVQAVNLLNEVTRTEQQFTLSGLRAPRSYFMNDRRFAFIIRGNF
jgi:TonB-dependent receptor